MSSRYPRWTAWITPVLLLLGACASAPDDLEVATTATLATTAPVGIPLQPTPTPIGIPAVLVPATDATAAEEAPAPVDPAPTATTEPTAVPESTATPEPALAATAEPEPTPVPDPTATPVPEPEAPAPESEEPAPEGPATESGERVVTDTGYLPLGRADSIPLVLPVGRVEFIGFHEASHPGAAGINAAGTGVDMVTMESRSRGTHERSAADIVVPPGEIVVAPATGTVIAANEYILYCVHQDKLVYIEPDGFPGWVVRVFHVEGELAPVGTRVVGGVTKIADGARTLPFESQVDELTAEPSWPHVHIEVVDTSVPDTRPPGPGCP